MEPVRRFETPLGPIDFRGRDTGLPVQLVITGAFAPEHQLELNQARFPELDVWRTHLPGNHCPPLMTVSVGAFGFALSHALRAALAGRRAQVVGLSVGALVALALAPDLVAHLVLVDPPLRPSSAWPLRQLVEIAHPDNAAFIRSIFGLSREAPEPRDYRILLEGLRCPAVALVGAIPLEPERELPESPSLVDSLSLAALKAHPLIDVQMVPGVGHFVLADFDRFEDVLRRTMPPP